MTPETRNTQSRSRRLQVLSWIVPAGERATWRREWQAEFAYDDGQAHVRGRSWTRSRLGAAFRHACWLRWHRRRWHTLTSDVRYAARMLARRPAFTLTAAMTLAIGIGGTAVLFGATRAIFLRPLPYPSPDALVMVSSTTPDAPAVAAESSVSPPDFTDWSRMAGFSGMAAIRDDSVTLTGRGDAEQIPSNAVTGQFFELLGVSALRGRTLAPADTAAGAPPVAVLSYRCWQRRFGADPNALGAPIVLDGVTSQIVGVMPPAFDFPLGAEVWTPLAFTPDDLATQRGAHYLTAIGRLPPGMDITAATAAMTTVNDAIAAANPKTNAKARTSVVPLHLALVGPSVAPALTLLAGAVGLVFLIACVNVASLVLGSAIDRRRDFALRTALGASRGRIVRGLCVESLLLAAAGGAGGLALAAFGVRAVAALDRVGIARLTETRLDPAVLGFTALATCLAAALFGAIPAWLASGRDVTRDLASAGARVTGQRGGMRARTALVTGEIAFAVAVLVSAGLLARSFLGLAQVNLGLETHGVQTFSVLLPDSRYADPARKSAFVEDLLTRVRAMPGVDSTGAVFGMPLTDFSYHISVRELDGVVFQAGTAQPSVELRTATPDFFRTIGVPVVHGRAVDAADRTGAPPVCVLNESAARLLWPAESALGHRVGLGTRFGNPKGERVGGTVVGIVADIHDAGPGRPARPSVWFAEAQVPASFFTIVAKTGIDRVALAASFRRALAEVDPAVPLFRFRTLDEFASASVAEPRLYLEVLALFACVAIALASVGIYGVMSQNVGARTREIGIRLALGATRRGVVSLVVGAAGRLTAVGVLLGLVIAAASRSVLTTLLFGVQPLDAATYVLVGATMFGIAMLAAWLPARRAAAVDPVTTLRAD